MYIEKNKTHTKNIMRNRRETMKKVIYILIGLVLVTGTIMLLRPKALEEEPKPTYKKEEGTVLDIQNDQVTIRGKDLGIYTVTIKNFDGEIGTDIEIEYEKEWKKNQQFQEVDVISSHTLTKKEGQDKLPDTWQDGGIFSSNYSLAYQKLQTLSLDEKIGQLLLVRYPDKNQKEILNTYHFGGYLFFAKDFKNKSQEEVQAMIQPLQEDARIPLLTAVDEEGGKVVRISSNKKLREEPFLSSRELYQLGGFERIEQDTIEKSQLLFRLGINLNLAPVVDVSTNPEDYMYGRSFGQNASLTSTFAETVIKASKNTGVSYTLKHFPGYGNNLDTHESGTKDERTYQSIQTNDLPPFEKGIKEGAEAVLVSHNTVTSIDEKNPASLSIDIHNLLRHELGFTGIVITDDLYMGAVSNIEDVTVKAILAGNDLIITTDYEQSISTIKKAIEEKRVPEALIDRLALRILSWKIEKGLIK